MKVTINLVITKKSCNLQYDLSRSWKESHCQVDVVKKKRTPGHPNRILRLEFRALNFTHASSVMMW